MTGAPEFLLRYGGTRCAMSSTLPFPLPPDENAFNVGEEDKESLWREYELPEDHWEPLSFQDAHPKITASDNLPDMMPRRFVDGKDSCRIAAWLQTPDGYPLPVRVGQIGAVALLSQPVTSDAPIPQLLRAESRRVERVVALEADFFPWNEVEGFAAALQANGYRLLIARRRRKTTTSPVDFAALTNTVQKRTAEEMFRLESRAVRGVVIPDAELPDKRTFSAPIFPAVPTVLDGRLEDKRWGFHKNAPVYGIIKRQLTLDYLHLLGIRVFLNLQPGQRTPLFVLRRPRLNVVTWYLRMDAVAVAGPGEGIVRVEVSQDFLETHFATLSERIRFVNLLSQNLLHCRTQDSDYSRSAVTLYPIQRAEELLDATFADTERVTADFYRLTQL